MFLGWKASLFLCPTKAGSMHPNSCCSIWPGQRTDSQNSSSGFKWSWENFSLVLMCQWVFLGWWHRSFPRWRVLTTVVSELASLVTVAFAVIQGFLLAFLIWNLELATTPRFLTEWVTLNFAMIFLILQLSFLWGLYLILWFLASWTYFLQRV